MNLANIFRVSSITMMQVDIENQYLLDSDWHSHKNSVDMKKSKKVAYLFLSTVIVSYHRLFMLCASVPVSEIYPSAHKK